MGRDLSEKGGAIARDSELRVAICEAEIERFPAIHARMSTLTGGKAVDQPGKFLQLAGLEDSEVGFCRGPGWHTAILAEKREGGPKPPSSSFGVKGT